MTTTYIGIDWADRKHDICALSPKGDVLTEFIITDDPTGFEQLNTFLKTQDKIEILIERPNGLLVEFLIQHGWCVKWIPPNISAFRRPRRSKTDTGDAFLLANLLRTNDEECRLVQRNSVLVEELRQIVDAHINMQKEQQRLTRQLRYVLKQYYPVLIDLFSKLGTPIALEFLMNYPTPQEAKQASLDEIRQFFARHAYGYKDRIPHKHRLIQRAFIPAHAESGYVIRATSLARVLLVIVEEVRALKRQIIKLFKQHPDADWWTQFPGLAELNGARLMVRIGDNRTRFESADHLRAVAGTVPITQHSGKRTRVLFRQQCSHPLRKAFFDFAMKSKRYCEWAEEYFEAQITRGHSKTRAYRALSNRWAGIVFKLWQTGEAYDEAVHQANRKRAQEKIAA
jgi:transposase